MDSEKTILRLEFAEIGKRKLEVHNFELVEVYPMKLKDCILRVSQEKVVVEARTNLSLASKYHSKVGVILGQKVQVIEFSLAEIDAIEDRLKTFRKSAKHKRAAGDLDTVSVKASPTTEDLKKSPEYKEMLGNDEINDARCYFVYNSSENREIGVTMGISSKGSVWFLNEVPEEVIDHVFSVVKSIKGF